MAVALPGKARERQKDYGGVARYEWHAGFARTSLALKPANIGAALGQRATLVVRKAAPSALRNDRSPPMVAGMAQAGVNFGNIRSFAVAPLS